MDISKLERNPEMVHAILKQMPDGSIMALKSCKIHIPVRYEEKDIATISNKVSTVAIFAIILDDKYYGIVTIPSFINLEPSYVNKIKIDDVGYYEMDFEEGSTVISSVDLIKKDVMTYYIYNEFIAGGKIPWFFSYSDIIRLFDNAQKFAGARVGANFAITDMVACTICRDSKDVTKFYRHQYKTIDQEQNNPPVILPLRNVSSGASNTTAKLLGSYFSDGMTSALINPSERLEHIEELLRR